jgi:SAM-dependent methyltransferase
MSTTCQVCGKPINAANPPFCPNCGVKIFTAREKFFLDVKKSFFDAPCSLLFKSEKESIGLPPLELREHVGGDGAFTEIGYRFLHHFKTLGNLKAHETVLDVGCGSGRIAIPLTAYISRNATYEGFDLDNRCIQWCTDNITSRYPNFHFQHIDIFNKYYNPDGKISPDTFTFPYNSETFDFVNMTSVFTHMLPQDMDRYFAEVSRVLKKGGRCLITYFLVTPESLENIAQKKSNLNFFDCGEGYYSLVRDMPEQVIAFEERYIRKLYAKNGLSINDPIHYGSWCGREKATDFQDIVIASKQQ